MGWPLTETASLDKANSNMDCESVETTAFDGHNWFLKHQICEPSPSINMLKKPKKSYHQTSNCKVPPPRKSVFYSQSNEDIDLYNAFFCNVTNGVFVEMGALDGVRFSNTKFFDDSLGWSGALIEASPRSALKLKQTRKNPRNIIFSEAACPEGQISINFIENSEPAVSGGVDSMSDSFRDEWHKGTHGKENIIAVPCRTLSAILQEFVHRSGANHVDFFSLDVEGGEFQVLKTFDFKVPVNSWIIEMDGNDKEKDESVRQLLKEHGYVRSRVKDFSDRNEIWVIPELDP
jgi:FkbM family methyltransferase